MAREPAPTLYEVALASLMSELDIGWMRASVKAAEVMSVIVALVIAADRDAGQEGRWPTQEEYATYWRTSLRSAQREWELFRKAFPGEESPDRIAQLVRDKVGARVVEKRRGYIQSLPASLIAA